MLAVALPLAAFAWVERRSSGSGRSSASRIRGGARSSRWSRRSSRSRCSSRSRWRSPSSATRASIAFAPTPRPSTCSTSRRSMSAVAVTGVATAVRPGARGRRAGAPAAREHPVRRRDAHRPGRPESVPDRERRGLHGDRSRTRYDRTAAAARLRRRRHDCSRRSTRSRAARSSRRPRSIASRSCSRTASRVPSTRRSCARRWRPAERSTSS